MAAEVTKQIRCLDDVRLSRLGGSAEEWLERLGGPCFFRVAGHDRSRLRAVVTLLHGNEPSGARAVWAWLGSGVVPATDVAFYLGSVEAALTEPRWAHRAAPGQRDANRCFFPPYHGVEGQRARELLDLLRAARPEALVDLHNNTGHSPAYGVGTRDDAARLRLVGLFADRYMLSDLRMGTLTEATEDLVSGVVIECGRAGDAAADAAALAGLERYLALEHIETRVPDLEVLHRPVRVALRAETVLAFGAGPSAGADLTVRADLDRQNFEAIGPGVTVGWLGRNRSWPFDARGSEGIDVSRQLFVERDGVVVTRQPMIPIMMTTSAAIAKQDCLFYAMQRRRAS